MSSSFTLNAFTKCVETCKSPSHVHSPVNSRSLGCFFGARSLFSEKQNKATMEQKKTLDLLFSLVCAALGVKYFTPNRFWGKHKTVSGSPRPKRRAAFVILASHVLNSSMCVSNTKYIRDGVSICPPLQMRQKQLLCVFPRSHIRQMKSRWISLTFVD